MQSGTSQMLYRIVKITMDRRGFFRRLSGRYRAVRPPGAIPEEFFIKRCNGCADCVEACPQDVIRLAANNLPVICFDHAGCTFCGNCAEVCKQDALVGEADLPGSLQSSWTLRAQISSGCLDKNGTVCRACESICENNAIRFYPAPGCRTDVFVRLEDCNGCGACVASCPCGAIGIFEPEIKIRASKENAA